MHIGIIGGGLAGLSLALGLADIPNLSVSVFEQKSQPADSNDYLDQYDARSIALASGSLEFFETLGVWSHLHAFATPIKQINIHRAGGWGRSRIIATEESVSALGHVIEAPRLVRILLTALQDKPKVALKWDATLTGITAKQDGYHIDWADTSGAKQAEHVALLIIADGLASKTCRHLGVERQLFDYGQQALVCNLDLAEPLNGVATEYFTAQGVIALLPLNEGATTFTNRAALVWVTDHQGYYLESIGADQFVAELETLMGQRIKIKQLGKRALYPLQGSQTRELVRANLMIMGSAAVGLHPVAAQGFNLTLRDVRAIRDLLIAHDSEHQPCIQYNQLAQYAEHREKDHQRVRAFIHFLLKTYAGAREGLPVPIQSAGLMLFDLVPGFKKTLAQFAMGARHSKPVFQRVNS